MRFAPEAVVAARYRLIRFIAQGGMGTVYEAEDLLLSGRVALKFIRPDWLARSENALARFTREVLLARMVTHANVCRIYDAGVDRKGTEATLFLSMELLRGETLAARLEREGPMSAATAAPLVAQMASGLGAAHRAGVVHRDFKPANVMLEPVPEHPGEARVVITDFGVARCIEHAAAESQTVVARIDVVGTPTHMAPEQANGEDSGPAADLFAFGVVLYEMVTGLLPFPATARFPHLERPVRPSAHSAGLDPRWDDVIMRCLERRPEDRFPDVQSAVAALRGEGSALRAPAAPTPAPRTPFFGRRSELAALQTALGQALAGHASLWLIAGDAGIGKSRLTNELCRSAVGRGARVLTGHCQDAEGGTPYLPFVEILEALDEPLSAAAPELDRYALFQSVTGLLRRSAESSGLVVVLEDLHWADKPSLLMLQHLARHSHPSRMLIVGTFRDVEITPAHPLGPLLTDLHRERLAERLVLRGLPADDVKEMVTAAVPGHVPEGLVRALVAKTEGNPFFVEETVRHLSDEGVLGLGAVAGPSELVVEALGIPDEVRELIGRRLARLGEGCRRTLQCASVMAATGGNFGFRLLAALGDEDHERLLDHLEEAVAARLIVERTGDGDSYRFAHALIRECLYRELIGPRRQRLHRRVGEAIEREHAARLEPFLADLAYHFSCALPSGDGQKAVEYGRRAGEQAATLYAYEEAVRASERALRALPGAGLSDSERIEVEAELHLRLARAWRSLGVWAEARRAYEAALAALGSAQLDRQAEVAVDVAMMCFWMLDAPGELKFAGEALRLAQVVGRDDLAVAARAAMAHASLVDGNLEQGLVQLRESLGSSVRDDARSPALVHAFQAWPLALYWAGEFTEALARAREGLEMARRMNDAYMLTYALPHLGLSLASCGQYREASQVFDEAAHFGREHAVGAFLPRALSMAAGWRLDVGDVAGAERLALEARELGRSCGFAPTAVSTGIDLMRCYLRREELDRAETLGHEVARDLEQMTAWHRIVFGIRWAHVRAERALARGLPEVAMSLAHHALRMARRHRRRKYEIAGLELRSAALHALGRSAPALADLEAALALARTMGNPLKLLGILVRFGQVGDPERFQVEAQGLGRDLHDALPDAEMQRAFRDSELGRGL
jgi:serine/threonine protein kinase/tetratricopeptide (TPR) repeat protein